MSPPLAANPVAAMVPTPSTAIAASAQPSVVVGPLISAGQLRSALQALDLCLQDFPWAPGENYLDLCSLFQILHAKGLTVAVIQALLKPLIEENVFRLYRHIIPAGHNIENGILTFRSEDDITPYLITTRERWYGYLAELNRASGQAPTADPADANSPSLSPMVHHDAESCLTQSEARAVRGGEPIGEEIKPAAPCRNPGPGLPGLPAPTANQVGSALIAATVPSSTAKNHLEFLEFPVKQRSLLLTLRGKGSLPIPVVMQAVYQTRQTELSALERLVTRTNQNLLNRDYHLEIKRKANTLSLQEL